MEECIDEIAILYDVRQSAANGTAPFFEDAQKREFHLRLMAEGLLHCAVLKQNDEIVAALLSVPSEETLVVGIFTISARHARDSPGKILMLLLAQRLVAEGIEQIDLTPGGEWKGRFADTSDTVHELILFFDHRTARAFRRHHQVLALTKRALASVGITRAFVNKLRAAFASVALKSKTWGFENYTVLILDDQAEPHRSEQEVTIREDDGAIVYPRAERVNNIETPASCI